MSVIGVVFCCWRDSSWSFSSFGWRRIHRCRFDILFLLFALSWWPFLLFWFGWWNILQSTLARSHLRITLALFFGFLVPIGLQSVRIPFRQDKFILYERKSPKGIGFDASGQIVRKCHFLDRSWEWHIHKIVVKIPQVLVIVDRQFVGWFHLLSFQFGPIDFSKKGRLFESSHSSDFKHGRSSTTQSSIGISIQESL